MTLQTATAREHDPTAAAARDRLCRAAVDAAVAALGTDASAWLAQQLNRGAAFVLKVELPSGEITPDLLRDGETLPLFSVRNVAGGNA
jgi:hypothetical protein